MALHSKWAAEFEEEVISKLASDDPLRAQIFDDNGVVREPVVPKATSLVYQWGTRLDKPDWRELGELLTDFPASCGALLTSSRSALANASKLAC